MGISSSEIEAANRAEATALLIRSGYRVYRPEADVGGEDLIVSSPDGELRKVQLKGRLTVDNARYGVSELWMLFPDAPFASQEKRSWYLVPHSVLFMWLKERHGHTPKWNDRWSTARLAAHQRTFLHDFQIVPKDIGDS